MKDTLSGETTHPAKLTLPIVASGLLSVANLISVPEKSLNPARPTMARLFLSRAPPRY